jgi:ABC-type glycerol-3-phosphate transport system substrate-binding protein
MCRRDRPCSVLLIAVISWIVCTLVTVSAPITIVHLTGIHGPQFYDFLIERAAAFEKQNPGVHIDIQNFPSGYADKLLVMLGTGSQVDAIDSTPTVLLKDDTDNFADLHSYLKADKVDLYRLVPSFAKPVLESEGQLLALPNQIYAVVAGYNRSLFDEMGIAPLRDLGDGWNWDWLKQNAGRLTIDVDGDGRPETAGIGFASSFENLTPAIHQAGGSFFERYLNPQQALLDTPQVRQGLGLYAELAQRGWLVSQNRERFVTSRANAISLYNTASHAAYLHLTEDTIESIVQPKGPVRRGGNLYFGPMRVMKASENPEWACRWLVFLLLSEESQAEMLRVTGRIPVHLPTLSRIGTYLAHETPVRRDFIKQAVDASLDGDNFAAIVSPIKTDIQRVFDPQFRQVINGTLALENFISDMQRQVQAMLDELYATP